jgi:hypothetical protein
MSELGILIPAIAQKNPWHRGTAGQAQAAFVFFV